MAARPSCPHFYHRYRASPRHRAHTLHVSRARRGVPVPGSCAGGGSHSDDRRHRAALAHIRSLYDQALIPRSFAGRTGTKRAGECRACRWSASAGSDSGCSAPSPRVNRPHAPRLASDRPPMPQDGPCELVASWPSSDGVVPRADCEDLLVPQRVLDGAACPLLEVLHELGSFGRRLQGRAGAWAQRNSDGRGRWQRGHGSRPQGRWVGGERKVGGRGGVGGSIANHN